MSMVDQLLDGDIDNIGQILFDLTGLFNSGFNNGNTVLAIGGNVQVRSDPGQMADTCA